ncbi:MAG: hypothetical protein ACRDTJ_15185, partial [Pseudonocardiaceae bacterium]
MRWDNLTLSDESAQEALFGVGDVMTRTFDTPEFRGMTFYEVRARSIVNKVPASSRMPFGWTLNPYRGCSHACRYCQPGDTPILMADGQAKPLAEVRVGDPLYGTVWDGHYRRYTVTKVLAHWRTVKHAYRVTLEDGTELVASGDHRFLTNRGWKRVTGGMNGADRRPYLTTSNELMGTGQFAAPPEDSVGYRQGYLCGLVRGDAHMGSYSYGRLGRKEQFHRVLLPLVDLEALRRARRYVTDAGAHARQFEFQAAGGTPATPALRNQEHVGLDAFTGIIGWPDCPDDAWCKGFLAGIFDAKGSFSGGVLR